MAGALTISTLNDSSGVLATQNGMSGISKAWVNFNGTNANIRASFNVSSVTRNGTGDYTVAFTTSMSDANYVVAGVASSVNAAGFGGWQLYTTPSVSSFRIRDVTTNTGTPQDNTYEMLAVFR